MLLDERGKMLTSREFADDVQRKMLTLQRNLVFIVGGPYGFSPAVYARANGRLALSRMTMTHEMARMFLPNSCTAPSPSSKDCPTTTTERSQ